MVFALTVALTSGALAVLHGLAARPSRWLELAVLVAASTCATVSRYIALRSWVFLSANVQEPPMKAISAARRLAP
jgi:hypothetical protein